jgi:arylsulfatase A
MNPLRLPSFLLLLSQVVLIGGNLVLGLSTLVGAAPTPAVKQPNVIVILTDDVGVGVIGCYGADPRLVRTPHIDRLATEGRRFTNASTPASVCSPTRYALLTGRYCWRTGALSSVYSVTDPLKIETTRPTIASILKAKGYKTAVVGKWHLGLGNAPEVDYTKPLTPGPLDVGFDYDFLISQNHGDITGVYIENDRVVGLRSDKLIPVGKSFYGKDYMGLDAPQRKNEEVMQDLTNKAVTWLGKQSAAKPFFTCTDHTVGQECRQVRLRPLWRFRHGS